MPHTHAPIQPEIEAVMRDIANIIDGAINKDAKGSEKQWGFALLMFGFQGSGVDASRMNYISNIQREDMLVAMKEFIARAEGRHHEHEVKQ